MATSNTKTQAQISSETVTESVKSVNLDEKVKVRSIAPWLTSAPRKTAMGEINIPPRGAVLLSREEVIAQAQSGNRLLLGIDNMGGHATWYVEDEYTRKECGFEDDTRKQEVLTQDMIKKAFDLKTQKTFEEHIKKEVRTRAEKAFLMNVIDTLGLDGFQKVSFCISYTGIKI